MSKPLASRLSSPKATPLIDRISHERPPSPIGPTIDMPPKEASKSPLVSLGTSTSPDVPMKTPPAAPVAAPPEPRRTSRISPTASKKESPADPPKEKPKKTAPLVKSLLPIPSGPVRILLLPKETLLTAPL
jgi:hypothetical protein